LWEISNTKEEKVYPIKVGYLESTAMSTGEKRTKKKRRWGKVFEYTSYERSLLVGDEYNALFKEIVTEYEKRKTIVVTPQELAAKHDIRVSVAKQILTDLEEKNQLIKKSFSNKRLTVYVKA
jgi:ribosomal protein S25